MQERASVAEAMEEILHLVAPELALVLHLAFACEILYYEDRLVGHFGFFDAKFEEFLRGSVHPVKADELFEFAFGNYGFIGSTIPGKAEHIIPFVYFICKPLLQSCGRA